MVRIICGNIKNDDVLEWAVNYKYLQQHDQFMCGYNWSIPSSIVHTNNDHFFNGVRASILDKKCLPENIDIIFYPLKGENKENGIRILFDKYGHCDHYPKGFFDEWDNALKIFITGMIL
jgi:hypothetical protein